MIRRHGLIHALKSANRALRRLSAYGHRIQFESEWLIQPAPEWYDHLMFQHWLWLQSRNPMSWERGVFSMLAMQHGCRVLDLCCGGGFFAHHFFSSRAASVVSVDFDPEAIAHARVNFRAPNVEYRCADIRTDMPAGEYDNVVWDAAIEHFTQEETAAILENIKTRLVPAGILSGYTIVERASGKSLSHHEYEYTSKEELAGVLKAHFKNVLVFENISRDDAEERHNLYFFASDSGLPFDPNWANMIRI
jgi:2-polyprenyl-3-methyl-5-hydroxy-6-metoxy-1,4-benzoquinol methylase